MKYIENSELREWVKENLQKSIFQKAHALAVQTGCEILVKLEDRMDISASQYYATYKLQQAYRRGCLRQRPGEMCISGVTGLPATLTVDMAVQSCETEVNEPQDVIHVGSSNNSNGVNHKPTDNSSHHSSLHPTTPITNRNTSEEEQIQLANTSPTHTEDTDNKPCDPGHSKWEATESGMTSTPANVKLEVDEVIHEENGGEDDGGDIDHFEVLNEDEENAMDTLPQDDDFYDDYYGSADLKDASNQMPSDNSMFQDTSLGLYNRFNPGPQHPAHMGRQVPVSDINRIQNMASATQNPSFSTQSTNSVDAGPIPEAVWSRAKAALPSSRIYRSQGPSIRRNLKIERPHRKQEPGLDPGNQMASAQPVDVHLTYPVTLPTFSHHVQRALENGTIHGAKVWSQFCKESAQFYLPMLDICDSHDKHSSNVYQSIGRTMYEQYPCIIGNGVRPWTYFNKWLSTKIRQIRFREKKKDQEF